MATGALYAALAADRAQLLHRTDQGPGQREVLRAVRRVRRRATSACSPATPRSTPTRPIIACTAEVLANIALREGAAADIGLVVMDEFHFYGDPDRGWAWQVPLLELPSAQFLLMSATLGDVTFLRGGPRPGAPAGRRHWSPTPSARCRCTTTTRPPPMHETIAGPAGHQAGARLRRALHPGLGAGAGAGADECQRQHQGGEGARSPR